MATRAASSGLPPGLRIRRRRFPVWLGTIVLAIAGFVLGGLFTQLPTVELLSALVVLVAAAIAFSRPSASLAMLAFIYPFDLRTFAGPVKLTTSAALMAIIVLTWVTRHWLAAPPTWQSTPLDIPVLLFAGATLFSVTGIGGHWEVQAVGLLKAAGGFLIFFIATQSLRRKTDVWLVLGAIFGISLIQAATTALPLVNGTLTIGPTNRASGSLLDANLFAGYLVLVMPLAIAVGVAFRSRWMIWPSLVVTLTFAIALIATWSRSGWLDMIVATGILLLLWPEQRRRVLAVTGSVAVILLAVGLFAPIGVRLGPGEGPLPELADRWSIWVAAVQITIHHPLGVGVGNFGYYLLSYGARGASHAHNLFLNILAERGVIGLAAFVLVLVSLSRTLKHALEKTANGFDRALVVGLIATFGGYLVHSIFDATYYDYKVLLLFWLLVAMVAILPGVLARREAGTNEPVEAHGRSALARWATPPMIT
jgi:putative inorganic carbon (hco3(-)) transporter